MTSKRIPPGSTRTRRPIAETRQERIANMSTLVFEALRDARVSAISGLPGHEAIAQASAARLRQELDRRESLLHLEELSNAALLHSRNKYRDLASTRLKKMRQLKERIPK